MTRTPARPVMALTAACAALLLLSACEKEDNRILSGERISVLQLQKDLVPNPALQAQPVALPEGWTNQFWPQAGGYPNHAMGHLALGANLKKAWSVSVGEGGGRRAPLTAAPVVAEGSVFTLDTAGEVRAFELSSGKSKWAQSVVPRGEEESGAFGGGLAYSSGRLFVTSGYKYIASINPETGALVWKVNLPAPARSAPTVMGERVYVITLDNRLMAFSAADGAALWNYAGISETTNLLGSAAAAADDTIVVLPLSSGELFGLRPENGRITWEDNLSSVRRSGSLAAIADIRGLPVIDQGIVYAVSYSGRMAAIDQVTGRRIWQREIGSAEMPWAAGNAVFVMSADQQMAALSRQTGDIHWVTPLPRFEGDRHDKPVVWTGPVLAGGRLLTASSDGVLAEINPADGKILRRQDIGGGVTIAPVVAANTLLLLSQSGELTAWR